MIIKEEVKIVPWSEAIKEAPAEIISCAKSLRADGDNYVAVGTVDSPINNVWCVLLLIQNGDGLFAPHMVRCQSGPPA